MINDDLWAEPPAEIVKALPAILVEVAPPVSRLRQTVNRFLARYGRQLQPEESIALSLPVQADKTSLRAEPLASATLPLALPNDIWADVDKLSAQTLVPLATFVDDLWTDTSTAAPVDVPFSDSVHEAIPVITDDCYTFDEPLNDFTYSAPVLDDAQQFAVTVTDDAFWLDSAPVYDDVLEAELLLDDIALLDLEAELALHEEADAQPAELQPFAPLTHGNWDGWLGSNSLLYIDRSDPARAEAEALHRLGYDGIALSDSTRAFIIQAFYAHTFGVKIERKLFAELEALREQRKMTNNTAPLDAEIARIESLLITDAQWLAVRIARTYRGYGLDLDDLIQHGLTGLMVAVRRFDSAHHARLITYASWWVQQKITRAICDEGRAIRLPVHLCESIRVFRKAHKEFVVTHERLPKLSEIATIVGMPVERVAKLARLSQRTVSLDPFTLAEHRADGYSFQDTRGALVDDNNDGWQDIEQTALIQDVLYVLDNLPLRIRRVLELRLGLCDGRERTLDEIGQQFGLTRERIRQIEAKAIRILRHPRLHARLKDYTPATIGLVDIGEIDEEQKKKRKSRKSGYATKQLQNAIKDDSVPTATAKGNVSAILRERRRVGRPPKAASA